ncbi:MAG: hypothetical protein ABS76_13165 [Pelagibacterium sp. SCN 64-44]|nr:MAG: hypothetical protein ABS76_13165 [Pelagibacterium sp. SCN 64-44]
MTDISLEAILADIAAWAAIESPTDRPDAVNAMISHLEAQHRDLGMAVERIAGFGGRGDKLIARAPWGRPDAAGILVISHIDTVHPLGTLARFPIRRVGDRLEGPGIFDMKGGACMALEAARSILRSGGQPLLPLTFLYVPDEEIGSQTSREIIAELARKARFVLVAEGADTLQSVVTARTGSLKFDLEIQGVAAHSGADHRQGRSALLELAHQIIALEAMTDYERDITFNVGTASGGTRANVVPDQAVARVDVRVTQVEAAQEALARIEALKALTPDVRINYRGGIWRLPYEQDAGIEALLQKAQAQARAIGFELHGGRGRGGSDANLVAPHAPVLDGLGPVGGGAHTLGEWIDLTSLQPRTRLLRELMLTLA